MSEYDAARSGAALLPVVPRTFLRLTGADRAAFLHGQVSQDVLCLAPGQSARAAMLSTTGHILADLFVHAQSDFLLVEADPDCLPRLHETLELYLITEDVQIADASAEWQLLSLRGPNSGDFSRSAGFAVPVENGVNLYVPTADAPAAREQLLTAGVVPVSPEVAEILRVEDGQPVWGLELSNAVLLPEAGIPDRVSYTKGCYVGQEIVARLHARGHVNKELRGVLLDNDAPIPHAGATLHLPQDTLSGAGREVGRITSAVLSPRFGGRALCLAYIRRESWDNGTAVDVHIPQPNGTQFAYSGTVLTRPFTAPAG